MLVAKYHESNCKDKTILSSIDRAVKSSLELRSKKELIESFIATITVKTDVDKDWAEFVKEQQQADIETLIAEEKLNAEELRKYLSNAFRDGQIKTSGTDIDKIMPPVSRFGGGARTEKKQVVIEKLQSFFEKYYGLI
jgi:type I restriction enzyme R subunit